MPHNVILGGKIRTGKERKQGRLQRVNGEGLDEEEEEASGMPNGTDTYSSSVQVHTYLVHTSYMNHDPYRQQRSDRLPRRLLCSSYPAKRTLPPLVEPAARSGEKTERRLKSKREIKVCERSKSVSERERELFVSLSPWVQKIASRRQPRGETMRSPFFFHTFGKRKK